VPRGTALQQLFLLDRLPAMTNRAAFGLAFDVHSSPMGIAGVNAGEAVGPLEEVDSPFGTGKIARPSDPSFKYTWQEYDQVTPRESTSLTDLSWAWTRTGADFGEWYFPTRLNLDGFAAASLVLGPGDWAYDAYGLKATHGREIDVPVLAMAAGEVVHASAYDALKNLLPPVGAGRPQAGAARSGTDGFEGVDHLAAFSKRVTPAGGVVVP